MTKVSIKTSAIAHVPCNSGDFILHELCTATVEPKPASFENAPRFNPSTMENIIVPATEPVMQAVGQKAFFTIIAIAPAAF